MWMALVQSTPGAGAAIRRSTATAVPSQLQALGVFVDEGYHIRDRCSTTFLSKRIADN